MGGLRLGDEAGDGSAGVDVRSLGDEPPVLFSEEHEHDEDDDELPVRPGAR